MSVSQAQLESAVRSASSKRPQYRRLAVRSAAPYQGPDAIEVGGFTWAVRWADSSLRARRVLAAHGGDGGGGGTGAGGEESRVVLVTPLPDRELGIEVLSRLGGAKVIDLDPWDEVKHRFRAAKLDPRVATHRWMAAAVLEVVGPTPQPISGGVLDLDRLWAELLRPLGILARSPGRPTVAEMLAASAAGDLSSRVERLASQARENLPSRFREVGGGLGELLGRMIVDGRGSELLPVGLVLDAVTAEPDPLLPETVSAAMASAVRVRTRLADRHGLGPEVTEGPLGEAWAAAARRWGESAPDETLRPVVEAADAMLDEYDGGPLAGLSRLLPSGRTRRRERLAEAIAAFVAAVREAPAEVAGALERLEASAERVLACRVGPAERRRVGMVRRLARWLAGGAGEGAGAAATAATAAAGGAPAALADLAAAERDDASWADRARLALVGGSGSSRLDEAMVQLSELAADRRERAAEAFARRLAEVHPADGRPAHGGDFLPLERLVPDVVARVIESGQKVLLVVMDGMSHAVMHAVAESIATRGGFERLTPAGQPAWPPVLAPLPTVTEVARASLLSGTVTSGGQDVEQSGFAALIDGHGWRERVGAEKKLLFHKGEVSKRGATLSSDLVGVLDSTAKLVGVIVNAVDDLLDKGDQILPEWSLDEMPILQALVSQAELQRRVIVLTADHGHVLDRGGTELIGSEQNAGRWRSRGDRPLTDREIVVGGPRVTVPRAGDAESAIVLPWSERCRYGRKAAGYHGGANPQEVCVPLAVFAPTAAVEAMADDWQAEAAEPPAWWGDPTGAPVAGRSAASGVGAEGAAAAGGGAGAGAGAKPKSAEPEAVPAPAPTPTLFEPAESREAAVESVADRSPERGAAAAVNATAADWIDAVLQSETYEQQLQFAGRRPPSRQEVAKVLVALDEAGGSLTENALASRIGLSPMRLRGVLQGTAAILNVDGYAAIEQDGSSSTVRLDRDRLVRQFSVGE